MLDEEVPDSAMGSIRVLADEFERVRNVALVDVSDFLTEKLAHTTLVELLEAVEQLEMGVVGDALPVEFQVVGVFRFIYELAKEQVDEFVKGVFPARDIVLAENGGEAVVLLLLIAGGNGLEIGEGVFVLADVVGLDGFLEYAAGGVVQLIGVPPDSMAVLTSVAALNARKLGFAARYFSLSRWAMMWLV